MNVAFFSTKKFDKLYFSKVSADKGLELTYFEAGLTEETLSLCQGYDAICVFVNDTIDAQAVATLSQYGVKYIALRSAGYNHVDINACTQHGIKVVRVPAYSPNAVAEHTMALLLTLNRKTHKAYQRVRDGNFSLDGLLGFDLYGKTCGIIGLGKIGLCFARICKGFGMNIVAYDPKPQDKIDPTLNIQYVDFNHLLAKADVISLHCPLVKENHHMIGAQAIAKMKKGVVLLNTGRGALIDAKALITGLKQGKFHSVGLDVYEQEGELFFEDHSEDIISDDTLMRLTTFPNVLITAHQGFFTDEAIHAIAEVTLEGLSALKNSGDSDYALN